jgi:DNA-binding CsgD family transcriptional regulator
MEAHGAMGGTSGRTRRQPHQFDRTRDVRAERLRERYALTSQEARVAILIGDGATVKEIASVLHMTLFTVRAHLRNIFIKVGVSRQVALVRVVLTADETREDD